MSQRRDPNGNIKHNLGFRQFSMRGKLRVTAEWNLVATVANLLKAITSGHLTIPALAAPPANQASHPLADPSAPRKTATPDAPTPAQPQRNLSAPPAIPQQPGSTGNLIDWPNN